MGQKMPPDAQAAEALIDQWRERALVGLRPWEQELLRDMVLAYGRACAAAAYRDAALYARMQGRAVLATGERSIGMRIIAFQLADDYESRAVPPPDAAGMEDM